MNINGEIDLENVKSKIIRLLKEKRYGLSISEISENLKIYRATAAKYLAVLEAEKKIEVRVLGKAKLHYPRGVLK